MKPATARHRTDATAKALMAEARRLGLGVLPLGGVVDVVLYLGPRVVLVDFKTPGRAAFTEGQGRAIAAGCPIHFAGDGRTVGPAGG